MLEEDLGIIGGLGDGGDAGREEIAGGGELAGIENCETADDVGDEFFGALVVIDVHPEQLVILGLEAEGGIGVVAVEEFLGGEEFAWRGGGELEASGRVEFMEFLEDLVTADILGMAEDIETAEPAGHGEAHEQEDEDRPQEEIVLPGRRGKVIEVASRNRSSGENRREKANPQINADSHWLCGEARGT